MRDWLTEAEKALDHLIETDHKLAELRTKWERDKRKAKRKHEAIYLRVTGNIPEREAQATAHPDFQTSEAAEMTSLLEYEKMKNTRDTNRLVIEFWRSWNRAKAEGQI
jgi:hypothetical protein